MLSQVSVGSRECTSIQHQRAKEQLDISGVLGRKSQYTKGWVFSSGNYLDSHSSKFYQKVKQSATVSVYDYLALPGQRVGRYTMFLKEIIKHTKDDHPDLDNLEEALLTAEEIANMSEDYHTKLIRIFHNMLQAIQNCPVTKI